MPQSQLQGEWQGSRGRHHHNPSHPNPLAVMPEARTREWAGSVAQRAAVHLSLAWQTDTARTQLLFSVHSNACCRSHDVWKPRGDANPIGSFGRDVDRKLNSAVPKNDYPKNLAGKIPTLKPIRFDDWFCGPKTLIFCFQKPTVRDGRKAVSYAVQIIEFHILARSHFEL